MHRMYKMPLPYYDNEDGTGGGVPAKDDADPNKQQQFKNNNENNDDSFADLWQTEQSEQQSQQQQNGADKTADNEKVFKDYLDSLNFAENVDFEKISEDLNTGNTDAMNAALRTVGQNAYKRAMIDANRLMDQKIESAVEQAVSKSRAAGEGDMAVRLMQSKLAFTKEPEIAPIAKTVLSRFLSKGNDVETSINKTEKFFKQLGTKSAKALGLQSPPRQQPRGGFAPPPSDNEGDEIEDWEEFLTA